MTANVLELTAAELRASYISSSKNVRFDGAGYIFEPKNSRLVIDFSSINPESIILIVKRLGGNGQFSVLNSNQEPFAYKAISKISQEVEIDGVKSLVIERGESSQGEISLLGVITKEIMTIKNWKYLLKNCSRHQGIRQIGIDLWATEGAVIEGDQIESITTDPPDMADLQESIVNFKASCKITDLNLKKVISISPVEFLPHREAPTPYLPLKLPTIPAKVPIPAHKITYTEPIHRATIQIIYNSDKDTNFTSKYKTGNKLVKSIVSNGEPWLVLKKNGVFTTPLTSMESRQTYSLIFDGKKVGGNGRVYLNFLNAANQPILKEVITLDRLGVREHRIMSPVEPIASVSWSMEEADCAGEVLFRKMIILPAQNANAYLSAQKNPEIFSAQTYLKDIILPENKKFVIVIPSYKNSAWCEKNILSCLNQNYLNFRIIFTDDCAPDDTFEKVSKVVAGHFNRDKVKLIKNSTRKGALENLYDMIYSCDDEEIVLTVDGDDWLAHDNVLNKLNEVYSSGDIWLTYGQYCNSTDGGCGVAEQIPNNVITDNSYRKYRWCATHLRTFYVWLFKNIKKEDLMWKGKFAPSAWDFFMMMPQLELAGTHSKFISEFLYVYNMANPISDHVVDRKLQADLDRYSRGMPRYQPLSKPSIYKKISVGLMLIATGKYDQFLQGIISSADSYFLKGYDVNYYIFSDKDVKISTNRKIINCPIEHRPFPWASMDRFKHFIKYQDKLKTNDYLYYCDVDSLFVDHIGTEILGELLGVAHCGFFGHPGPVESNPNSSFYKEPSRYRTYYGGGFSGGKTKKYLELSKWCLDGIEKDLESNILAIFHDESAINSYFVDIPPTITLSPSYHYPASNIKHYQKIWRGNNFSPKILLLDKDHASVRSMEQV